MQQNAFQMVSSEISTKSKFLIMRMFYLKAGVGLIQIKTTAHHPHKRNFSWNIKMKLKHI